jgi:hypothetical protein
VISLNLVLAGLRLGLKNRQVGEKWVSDDCSYLCKDLLLIIKFHLLKYPLRIKKRGYLKQKHPRIVKFQLLQKRLDMKTSGYYITVVHQEKPTWRFFKPSLSPAGIRFKEIINWAKIGFC